MMGLSLPLIMIVNMRFGFYMTQKHQEYTARILASY